MTLAGAAHTPLPVYDEFRCVPKWFIAAMTASIELVTNHGLGVTLLSHPLDVSDLIPVVDIWL